MNIGRFACASALALGCAVSALAVSPVYIEDDQGSFGTIDTGGVFSFIGVTRTTPTGPAVILGDLGVTSAGDVFGTGWSDTNLYRINTSDAGLTLIGDMGVLLSGATFRSDGVLFGGDISNLYTIDTTTGAATTVGAMGTSTDGDFQFDDTGTMYMTGGGNKLYTIDTTTGAASLVGNLGATGFFGLAFQGGTLYGFSYDQKVYSIDRSTGAATFLSSFSGDVMRGGTYGADTATASVPGPAAAIPMLLGVAAMARRRRKNA